MKTTAIMNLKGGTAKTVTAINLAAILAGDYGQRVLLIDADSQANLTEFVTAGTDINLAGAQAHGFAALLLGKSPAVVTSAIRGADLIAASDELMELDVSTVKSGKADPMQLTEFLQAVSADYDRCIIDCPPAFSASATAALIAADEVIIPMKLDAFGIRGMTNLLAQVSNMKRVNPALTVAGILPTMFYRTAQMVEAEQQLKGSGLPVFSHIRRSAPIDNMTFAQKPIIRSSPRSAAAHDYRRFVAELLEGGVRDGV